MLSISKLIKVTGPYGIFQLSGFLTCNYPRILMYHRFSNASGDDSLSISVLEDQLKYLRRHFDVVSLSEVLVDRSIGRKASLSRPKVALTIDDGYSDFYDLAFPLLKKYKMSATFYVASGFIDGMSWFWYDRLKWCLNNSGDVKKDLTVGDEFIEKARWNNDKLNVWRTLVSSFLKMSWETIEFELKSLSFQLKIDIPKKAPAEFSAVTWDQLREMQSEGIEIGGHSVHHYSLGKQAPEKVRSEVQDCAKRLNEELGPAKRPFCFPNGQPDDVPRDYRSILQDAGFSSSVVAYYDKLGVEDTFALRRHGAGNDWFGFLKSVWGIDRLGACILNRNSIFDWRNI